MSASPVGYGEGRWFTVTIEAADHGECIRHAHESSELIRCVNLFFEFFQIQGLEAGGRPAFSTPKTAARWLRAVCCGWDSTCALRTPALRT